MVASTMASRVRSERRVRPSVGRASCTMPAGYVRTPLSPAAPPPIRGGRPAASGRRERTNTLTAATVPLPVGADQVLVDGHPGGVALHRDVLVGEDELQRLRAAEQREPRARHRAPPVERAPARVGARHPVVVLPHVGHGVEVAGLEGVVEAPVGPPHLRLGRGVARVLLVGGRVGHRPDAIRLAWRRPTRMQRCAR